MINKELKKATALKEEINRLSWFIETCKSCWHVFKIIPKTKNLIMKTRYGYLHDEIEIDGELSEKIINVIEQHINEKKEEFEKL